eukprot:TRINITY_DN29793_c0_g1_i1.p1 TRINITY_DN29793_c0_g1~~TRINITY_DN29793_c0_g1_i1.p1  ORF type:complete len:826 (+),score=213.59 TRINITY_DN29793_c0_g1_i1:46-2523(+)
MGQGRPRDGAQQRGEQVSRQIEQLEAQLQTRQGTADAAAKQLNNRVRAAVMALAPAAREADAGWLKQELKALTVKFDAASEEHRREGEVYRHLLAAKDERLLLLKKQKAGEKENLTAQIARMEQHQRASGKEVEAIRQALRNKDELCKFYENELGYAVRVHDGEGDGNAEQWLSLMPRVPTPPLRDETPQAKPATAPRLPLMSRMALQQTRQQQQKVVGALKSLTDRSRTGRKGSAVPSNFGDDAPAFDTPLRLHLQTAVAKQGVREALLAFASAVGPGQVAATDQRLAADIRGFVDAIEAERSGTALAAPWRRARPSATAEVQTALSSASPRTSPSPAGRPTSDFDSAVDAWCASELEAGTTPGAVMARAARSIASAAVLRDAVAASAADSEDYDVETHRFLAALGESSNGRLPGCDDDDAAWFNQCVRAAAARPGGGLLGVVRQIVGAEELHAALLQSPADNAILGHIKALLETGTPSGSRGCSAGSSGSSGGRYVSPLLTQEIARYAGGRNGGVTTLISAIASNQSLAASTSLASAPPDETELLRCLKALLETAARRTHAALAARDYTKVLDTLAAEEGVAWALRAVGDTAATAGAHGEVQDALRTARLAFEDPDAARREKARTTAAMALHTWRKVMRQQQREKAAEEEADAATKPAPPHGHLPASSGELMNQLERAALQLLTPVNGGVAPTACPLCGQDRSEAHVECYQQLQLQMQRSGSPPAAPLSPGASKVSAKLWDFTPMSCLPRLVGPRGEEVTDCRCVRERKAVGTGRRVLGVPQDTWSKTAPRPPFGAHAGGGAAPRKLSFWVATAPAAGKRGGR